MTRPSASDSFADCPATGTDPAAIPAATGFTLGEAAAQLRQQTPDLAVQDTVLEAVAQAAQSELRHPAEPAPLSSWLGFGLAAGLVAASVAALVMHATQEAQHVIERERLVDLALEDDAPEEYELELSTDQHDADHRVRIEAPAHVTVSLHPQRPSLSPRCSDTTCVHEFARDENTTSRLRLSVSRPGAYPIRVHHDSPGRRVRQDILLRASTSLKGQDL